MLERVVTLLERESPKALVEVVEWIMLDSC